MLLDIFWRKPEYKKEIDQYKKQKAGDEPKCPFPQCPFPNIFVLKTGEEKYAVISGVHRLKSAQKAGLTGIHCNVLTDREEAIKQGLQDNRQHGLQLSRGDLRKCILIAQKEFGGRLSKREIARLVGCSHAYLNSVFEENQLEGTFQLDAKVQGKDGKLYQATKPKREKKSPDKTTSGQTKKQLLGTDYGEVSLGMEDTGGRNSVSPPVVLSELESNDIQAPQKPCATGNVEESQGTAPLCELPDSLDDWEDNVFVEKFGEWIERLPIDDERRLTLFPELIRKLLDGVKKRKSRIQLRQWLAEYLAPCSD